MSVLVLKEGWDVKNVTTIVGLRAFSSDDNILSEQTLGRGLRRIKRDSEEEIVSIIGTQNFIDFIESVKEQGVEFDKKAMGGVQDEYDPILIEVDRENTKKDLVKLDIEVPLLTPKIYRAHEKLSDIDESKILKKSEALEIVKHTPDQLKEIVFERAFPSEGEDREHHRLEFDANSHIDITNLIRWFVREIKIDMRLGAVENILYSKLKSFIENYLFGDIVDLRERNIAMNLSRLEVKNLIFSKFKSAINEKTVLIKNTFDIKSWLQVSHTKPFHVKHQAYRDIKKSVFNKIVGDSQLELDVAVMLDGFDDIISFAKNYLATNFRLDYQNTEGNIANYIPDFLVKTNNKTVYIIETKGNETLDDEKKFKRLVDWCRDVNTAQNKYEYIPLYVKEDQFRKYQKDIKSFSDLLKIGNTGDKI